MLTELDALIILTTFSSLGSIRIRFIVQYFGSALNALEASPKEIAELPDFGERIASNWRSWRTEADWKKNFELIDKHGITVVTYLDPRYPKKLLSIHDYPVLLYVKGEMKKIDEQSISVIGTRQATLYGKEMARKISAELSLRRFTVISGLARGIDTEAHWGALEKGRTIAVIGSGLANIYPRENERLAEKIVNQGALISEFPMNTPPDRQNFPQRNRIVSAMSQGTVLIEAPLKSGAMLTVERSIAYGIPVFVLPGRADCENFQGNHLLLKQRKATLIENADDIVKNYEDLFCFHSNHEPAKPHIPLSDSEKVFCDLLSSQEMSIDEIVQKTNLPVMKVNVLLMSLVLKKAIKEFPGQLYKKTF